MSKGLGWIAVAAAIYWLYADYQRDFGKAVKAGWATLILTGAHIATSKG